MNTKKLQLLGSIFPTNAQPWQVLTVDSDGNRTWTYPQIMDGTLASGYQSSTTDSGQKEQLFIVDIASPILGTFQLNFNHHLYVEIRNGDTVLVNKKDAYGNANKIMMHHISNEYVDFAVYYDDGGVCDFSYSVLDNTWNHKEIVYGVEKVDQFLSEKIGFENTIEYTPIEEYNPATKKYVDNSINAARECIVLLDSESGYEYCLLVKGGVLTLLCKATGIRITTPPTRTEYVEGDTFDPTGMVVVVERQDGTEDVIDNNLFSNIIIGSNGAIELSYTEMGFTYTISSTCTELFLLVDFEYIVEEDGMCNLTGWKETLNRMPSTEMIIPDSNLIKL